MSNETAIQKLLRDQEATLFGTVNNSNPITSPNVINDRKQPQQERFSEISDQTIEANKEKRTTVDTTMIQSVAIPLQEKKKKYINFHNIDDEIHQVFGPVRTEHNRLNKTRRQVRDASHTELNASQSSLKSNSDPAGTPATKDERKEQSNPEKLIEDEIRQAKGVFPHLVNDYHILKRDFTRLLQDSTQNIFRMEELETELSKTKIDLDKERQCKMNLDCIKRMHMRLQRVEHEKIVLLKLVKTYRERLEGTNTSNVKENQDTVINDAWVVPSNKPEKDEISEITERTQSTGTEVESPATFIPKVIRIQEASMSSNRSIEI